MSHWRLTVLNTAENVKQSILVVDDNSFDLNIISDIIKAHWKYDAVSSAFKALRYLANSPKPSLILLDINMPEMNGFELIQVLKENNEYKDIPVIFITSDISKESELNCFKYGGADYITKPYEPEIVVERIKRVLHYSWLRTGLRAEVFHYENLVKEEIVRQQAFTFQILTSLSSLIDAKDDYTHGHSQRVAKYATLIGRSYGLSEDDLQVLHTAALLHDIGKIGVSDIILRKEGKLNDEEYKVMQEHPLIGYRVLRNITTMPDIADVARWHHERWDGQGYPDKISGYNIKPFARIVAIADSFDAMTSDRSYRKALSISAARAELSRCIGTQFDPDMCSIAIALIDNDTLKVDTKI